MHPNGSPITVTHWGAYRVAESGGMLRVSPFERDPDPSPIGRSLEATRRNRVERPAIRRGWLEGNRKRRGRDEFIEVTWQEALDRVAHEIDRVRTDYGNDAIYGGSYGWSSASRVHHAPTLLRRFLTLAGGYVDKVNTYSHAAGEVLIPHILGMSYSELQGSCTPLASIAKHTDLLISFGGIPLRTAQIQNGGTGAHLIRGLLEEVAASGTRLVNISPIRSDLDGPLEAEWIPCRPGSDTAVMLAMIHTLIGEELVNEEFLATHTVGWDKLRSYILGPEPKTPEWASQISTVPAGTIRSLAREAAQKRSMVSATPSLQRAEHGEQPWWALVALASAIGQIGLPGGGFGLSYGAFGSVGNGITRVAAARLPSAGPNPVEIAVPVARISDMLLDPGGEYEYDGSTHTYPDIRLIYWAGGNPFHHQQDLRKLEQAWERPETVVINETFWTATALRADIVLPATTSLERSDLAGAATDDYLFFSPAVIPPHGEARDDYEIFSELAKRLGVIEQFTLGRSSEEWIEHLYEQYRSIQPGAPRFQEFRQRGFLQHSDYSPTPTAEEFLARFRADPGSAPLGTPSGLIELFSETIASFGYESCPGHASWLPPSEWKELPRYPIHIVSNQPATRLHSQYDHGVTSQEAKIEGIEALLMNRRDADERGLSDGDIVRVFNDRGACLAGVRTSEDIAAGVAALPTGAPYDPDDGDPPTCRRGNVNAITQDRGTSELAQGSSAQTCLAQIELFRSRSAD